MRGACPSALPGHPLRLAPAHLDHRLDMLPTSSFERDFRTCGILVPCRAMVWLLGHVILACGSLSAADPPLQLDFVRDVRPILSDKCFRCHGPDEASREADLRLDDRESALGDGDREAAIVPGKPDASELIARIESTDADEQMPPPDSGLTVSRAELERLKAWIAAGAPYDKHWAFRSVVRPAVPLTKSSWGNGPIDRFVLARLETAGLTPSPEADRRTLIRRLSLDLLGLPPTPRQIDDFVADQRPDAYERLVDSLLASSHFGERWARHWLDQARYADTNGYTVDSARTIWPYRDWVIAAFNDDMPFDQFTIEQLAGDLLPNPTREQLVATGFHRNTLVNQEGGADREQFRVESIVDRVNTTGAVWLGLTVGCAQCHSHKFDPLTQREFYQLFAFFNHTTDANSVSPTLSLPTAAQQAELREMDERIAATKQKLKDLTGRKDGKPESVKADSGASKAEREAITALQKELKKLEQERKKLAGRVASTMIVRERSSRREDFIMIRGDFLRRGEAVSADVPSFLPALGSKSDPPTRLDLARWLVRRDHPLTARVFVNRVWMQLMGAGIVETENDFGYQGTPPSHPELLDYLAAEFMEQGWSLKSLIKQIVRSATYRQSSVWREEIARVDPRNRLRARQSRWRVEAEIVRDSALAVSGLLTDSIGGPSVYPPQPDGVYAFTQRKASWPTSKGAARYRRGMYTFFMRSAPYPLLTTFDVPRMNTTCTRRSRSNTPLQALTMANGEAFLECARALGVAIAAFPQGDAERMDAAYQRVLGRRPAAGERQILTAYYTKQLAGLRESPDDAKAICGSATESTPQQAAWILVARVLLNLDEFITRE